MHVKKYTEEYRQDLLRQGERSFFHFTQGIIGVPWLNDIHWDLCSFLEGRRPHYPWNRAAVVAYRGSGKSTLGAIYYPMWRGLYIPDYSAKLIGNSSDNVRLNQFSPLLDTFISSPRASFLRWLYQHRIPADLSGWNSKQIALLKDDPRSPPTITYWGIESKFEGWHGDLVVLDDPEGADAEKSDVANEESYRAWQKATPLLKDQASGQVLGIMTPHGHNPLCYRLRNREQNGSLNNEKRSVKLWWLPILDSNDEPHEPHRFPPHILEMMQLDREIWDTQYMLRHPGEFDQIFDMEQVLDDCFDYVDPRREIIRYKAFELDPDDLDEEGFARIERVPRTVRVAECRAYMQVDPTHTATRMSSKAKRKKDSRPSENAVVLCLVAPDSHVFLWAWWTKDCEVDRLVREMFRLYRLCGPIKVIWEPYGAQVWLKDYVQAMEEADRRYKHMESPGYFWPKMKLPRMSQRMVESERSNESKESVYRSVLAGWINKGVFHFEVPRAGKNQKPLHQLENCLNEQEAVDIIDAIAQGAPFWKPPPEATMVERAKNAERFVRAFVRDKTTGFVSPWSTGGWD